MLRRIVKLVGGLMVAAGVLYGLGVFDRDDRVATTEGGSVETANVRARWAPGLGLLLVTCGVTALVLARRRPDLPPPA